MRLPCITCGRVEPQTCQNNQCPYFSTPTKKTLKKDFFGQAPNLFVGRYGYPNVRVGLLATEEYADNDNPKKWTAQETSIPDIMDLRSSLVNSQFQANIKDPRNQLLGQAQLVAQASKPAEMEVNLEKTPAFRTSYPQGASPHGASVKLIKSSITENVRIPKQVDKVVHDELRAQDQLEALEEEINEYQLTKLLTSGLLGEEKTKKLVPTRWGITAVDDSLAKKKLRVVRELPIINEPTAYFGGHYGNFFCVLLFNHHWQYELFEFATGKRSDMQPMTDYEPRSGRTNYAQETAGGYYASRLPVLEHLLEEKRQASALVIRFITDEYTNPLGVWVVREAVRKALESKPLTFASQELLIKYAQARMKQFDTNYELVLNKSKLLKGLTQKTLGDY